MSSLRAKAATFPVLLSVILLAAADLTISAVDPSIAPTVFYLSLVCVVLAIVASVLFARQLVRPINELMPTVDREGHLELRTTAAGVQTPEELQALTRAIDNLAESQQRDKIARQKLERVRSEFLGNVSHELRTPIFAVQGFIETLLDGAINDPKV